MKASPLASLLRLGAVAAVALGILWMHGLRSEGADMSAHPLEVQSSTHVSMMEPRHDAPGRPDHGGVFHFVEACLLFLAAGIGLAALACALRSGVASDDTAASGSGFDRLVSWVGRSPPRRRLHLQFAVLLR